MALRRSPRLRPSGSGFSSGSSPGAARGSGPGSSGSSGGSRSSSRTPEFPDDPDSGSDFEASLRPRSKRGPPRAAAGSRVPKRSRASSEAGPEPGPEPEPNSLFQALFSGKAATETVVDEWLEWYRREQEAAFLELLSCTVRACGCRGVITPEMFRELQNSEIIRRLTETFNEDSAEYPLSRRSGPWRRFRAALSELPAALVQRGRPQELRDGFLLDSWLAFLTGLSDSQVRAFRHTGTLAALKLLTALVSVAVSLSQQLLLSGRQLEAERGKEPGRRGSERLELLLEQRRELREQQEELELLMNGIFKGVFVHRYRDVVPEIRALCMEELGAWMRKFPESFLSDGHLKYLGWTLHDKGDVRLRCVRALRGVYGLPEMAPGLELFTARFKPRLVAMAHDKEPEVALEVLELLTELDRNLEEALSPEDCRSLFPVVFVSSRPLASAAGKFLFQRLLDPQRHSTGSGSGAGDNRGFFLRLLRFFLDCRLHQHGAYLVDSLWDCAGSRLRDWDTATGMLLGAGPSLELCQEQALLELLSCSGQRLSRGRPPAPRSLGRKVSSRERREQRQERARLSRSLIPALPQLLRKFSAEPEAVAALLELLQHLELGMFRSQRWEKCLEQVLERIQELFGKHSQAGPVLGAASRALRALSDPDLPLHGLAEITCAHLGDSLGDRCHLQVTELLQAQAPDEEDVYALAATLRRLSALFNDHDLTPWGLFEPLSQLLRRALDTGEVPAEVTIPAVSCLFFHLLWELARIPEAGAAPGDLRGFRARAVLLLSLCQSCLAEPQAGLRERAFLVLSDLLLVLGPGLPQAGLRLLPEPALQAQLGLALSDLVFCSPGQPQPQSHEAAELQLGALHERRRLLAAFCRLLLQGALEPRAATDVFRHYSRFHGEFGDIIRETLRATREQDRLQWAQTLLLTLRQVFTELLLQEGPGLRALPEFRELRDLGRRLALLFSLQHLRCRRALLHLHSEGIRFALQPPPPELPLPLPVHLPFLEVLSEFSPRLLRPDRALLLALLERTCRERGLGADLGADFGDLGDFGAPLRCYRRSLSPPTSPTSPPGPPRETREAREASPAPRSSSPWPPSPALTSTLRRGAPSRHRPSPHLLSSDSRRTWGSRLSLMEEEEEEEEEEGEETPRPPRSPLEQPRDLLGSSGLELQTF